MKLITESMKRETKPQFEGGRVGTTEDVITYAVEEEVLKTLNESEAERIHKKTRKFT